MARVYPVDEKGRCLKGFCPTIVSDEQAEKEAMELASNMLRHGFGFESIVIETDAYVPMCRSEWTEEEEGNFIDML